MITMEPKIQSTTSTRALRSKIGPIKAYLFKTSYVISPITPSDLKHSMKGAYKSFLSKIKHTAIPRQQSTPNFTLFLPLSK
jgi:two-component system cell cycle sensor histidine kinase PleC